MNEKKQRIQLVRYIDMIASSSFTNLFKTIGALCLCALLFMFIYITQNIHIIYL